MFSVIFEVCPKAERFDEYLALAKRLKPLLEKVDGFVDNERFESKRRPGWILSHSTWRDEKSVVRWRTAAEHHAGPEHGRSEILRDYHLRVGDVTADTDAPEEAPIREQRFDETEIGAAKLATLTEITPASGRRVRVTRRSALRSRPGCIARRRGRARRARQHLQSRQVRGAGLLGRRKGREPMDARQAEGGTNPAAPQGSDRA